MTILKFGYCQNIKWYAIFGKAIRFFEKLNGRIDASHCYVEAYHDVQSPKDVYRIESVWPHGRVIKNKDHTKKYKDVAYYYFLIPNELDEVLSYADKFVVGKKYSFSQNIFLASCNLIIQALNLKNWTWLERIEFNGRVKQNCTEAQIMILAKFLNIYPTEGLDNFSVTEAHDLVKSVWELKGMNK